ncbi:hypothetical protein JMJ77_0015011 [Colletotrichum scovillei]|uniref:Uncharacterized protein n=1 Tax=Colletotrichum scovillei TaxID=1209932 RepID=A0A9P7QZM2_9PEZI|nr:hypothetical protein JMJ77_0015011 [Colletotrichum scovillei]KAG7056664.1 hypothetical protein JMJ78_0000456 [Colletotrichum scovillei]KAG7066557.1 hypothetical protein JMJ76_0000414 [Colletotrichum scovillei]
MQVVHVMQGPMVSPGPVPCSASDFPYSRHPAVPGSGSTWDSLACLPAPPIRQVSIATRMTFGQLAEASFYMANQRTWSRSTCVDENASETEVICPVSPRPGILRIARLVSDMCCF